MAKAKKKDDQDKDSAAELAKAFWRAATPKGEPKPRRLELDEFLEIFDE